MRRRALIPLIVGLATILLTSPAVSVTYTTTVRTIQDTDGDNLLEYAPGEDYDVVGRDDEFRPPHDGSILNFLQMSDFQMVDEESPGRVEFLDSTQRGPFNPFSAAYRPQESMTTHFTEAMVRSARNTVSPITQEQLDLTILTGDNADSQQYNETRWFIDILDGTTGQTETTQQTFTVTDEKGQQHQVELGVGPPDKIDPNSGIEGICDFSPGSIYDGVKGGGKTGYYNPDFSDSPAAEHPVRGDGDGYSPHREENFQETGRDRTVRDFPRLFEDVNEPFEALGLAMPWYSAFGNHDALVQGNSPDAYVGPFGASGETSNEVYQRIVTGCVKVKGLSSDGESATAPLFNQLNPLVEELDALAGDGVAREERERVGELRTQIEDLAADIYAIVLADVTGGGGPSYIVPPDPRRCFVAKDEPGTGSPPPCASGGWIEQHFATTGTPVGHGFAPAACPPVTELDALGNPPTDPPCTAYGRPPIADLFNDGYYSFSPTPGLRFVVLDTITDECGSVFCSEGSVDDAQFRWLETQMNAAAAQGEYVMTFSHHTLRTTRFPSTDVTEYPMHYGQRVDRRDGQPQNQTGGETLEELYCRHNNFLAHIAGHEHENYVLHYRCSRDVPPVAGTNDFWHVSTSAHIDWPQQSRMIELVDNGDGTMSLVLTMLDHDGPPYPGGPKPPQDSSGEAGEQVLRLASIGREISYNDYQSSRGSRGSPADRNVIIVLDRPWPYPTNDAGDGGG